MSVKKRGGSRLEKNMPAKNQQDTPAQGPAESGGEQKKKFPRWAKILLIVLAALAVVVLALLLWYKSWAVLPELPTPSGTEVTADPETGLLPSQHPMVNSPRKKDFYTFLVSGKDTGGGGNTDTMMLVAYDIPNQKLSVMSLPRDTMVDARHPDRNRKLNGVWNLGLYYAKKDEKKEGVEYLKEAVGDLVGFVPDFYVVVNWEAFGRLVDAIGGVEFEVPFNMKYNDPTQNLHIDVAAGKRVLTGKEAMGVVRWRHNNSGGGYATGDLGRIQTQQALMKEVVKKCLKIENVTNIKEFAAIFVDEVETDLTVGNLVAFAERAILGGLKMDNVIFTTMPNTAVYVGVESYVQANPDELLGVLNDGFNPYKEDLTMDALHILQYKSSTGYYVYSGTGTGTTPTYSDPRPATMVGTSQSSSKGSGSTSSKSGSAKPTASDSPETTASSSPDPSTVPETEESGHPIASSSPRPSSDPTGIGDPDSTNSATPDEPTDPSASSSEEPEPPEREPETPSSNPASAESQPAPSLEEQPAGIPMD